MAYNFNASTAEAEVRGSLLVPKLVWTTYSVSGKPGLHNEF